MIDPLRLGNVNNDLKTVLDFLGTIGPEVSARVLEIPPDDAARKIRRFAAGGIGDEERREVCTLLQLHPTWVRYLADRVKESRKARIEREDADG